jgi:hypothetical protein
VGKTLERECPFPSPLFANINVGEKMNEIKNNESAIESKDVVTSHFETTPLVVAPKVEQAEPPLRPGQQIKTKRVVRSRVESNVTKQTADEAEYVADEYSEIVSGTMVNHEQPGNPIEFWFRGNGCPDITKFDFPDNGYVKMSVGTAEHINKNCWIGKDKDGVNEVGKPAIITGRKVRRFTFYPSGYFGSIDLTPVGEPMLPLYKQ